jgi:hypothetical protein
MTNTLRFFNELQGAKTTKEKLHPTLSALNAHSKATTTSWWIGVLENKYRPSIETPTRASSSSSTPTASSTKKTDFKLNYTSCCAIKDSSDDPDLAAASESNVADPSSVQLQPETTPTESRKCCCPGSGTHGLPPVVAAAPAPTMASQPTVTNPEQVIEEHGEFSESNNIGNQEIPCLNKIHESIYVFA